MSLYLIVHSKYYKCLLKLVVLMEKLIFVEQYYACYCLAKFWVRTTKFIYTLTLDMQLIFCNLQCLCLCLCVCVSYVHVTMWLCASHCVNASVHVSYVIVCMWAMWLCVCDCVILCTSGLCDCAMWLCACELCDCVHVTVTVCLS